MYRIKALNHSKALIEYSNDLDNTKKIKDTILIKKHKIDCS